MERIETGIDGLTLLRPRLFQDDRGYFMESFNRSVFEDLGLPIHFVQDNESQSEKGVLRGLHFQRPPYAQAKLVRVIRGSALDVVVDLRKSSSTFGQHRTFVLDDSTKDLLFIPEGFAHGFLALQTPTLFSYKCSRFYCKESEDALRWNDPQLNVQWGLNNPILSEKDKVASFFKDFVSPFN
jgi:dTDP-4-dehydrorhamnose 3,5-epimerase